MIIIIFKDKNYINVAIISYYYEINKKIFWVQFRPRELGRIQKGPLLVLV